MPAQMKDIPQSSGDQKSTRGLNGISLGVHEVFNASEQDDYLRERFARWNVSGPPGYKPHLHDLPPVQQEDGLRLGANAKFTGEAVEAFRSCAGEVMDYYFPPIGNESVVQDILAFTSKPYHSHSPGTGVVIRRTNKAVLFYIDPSVHVEADGTSVTNIRVTGYQPKRFLAAASPIDEAKIATKILGQFAVLLPGPAGTIAKFGIGLMSMILDIAGSSGPSWSEITAMMRQVVREELITNDLEYIQADYESVKKWCDIQYLPNKEGKSKKELWEMLRPQIDLVSRDINLLLQTNHRIPGFGLLLLGVDMYLSLLQEQIFLGYDADIRKAGDQWATDMLEVWQQVQTDRHNQVQVKKYSYGVYAPPGDVITCYYWSWTDKKTNESKGSRNGPWQAGGKHDHSKSECQADAEAHYKNKVLPLMISTFGNPEATAKAWRTVALPS